MGLYPQPSAPESLFSAGAEGGRGGLAVLECTLPCGGGGVAGGSSVRLGRVNPVASPWARGPLRGRTSDSPGGTPLYIYIYIYYYTPLPLNLANKPQQASNNKQQQALLLTVLAIAPPHRSGLYSTLAILEPRWWPCKIQVLGQKLTGGGPGRGRQLGRCPPKSALFWAKNSHFRPK